MLLCVWFKMRTNFAKGAAARPCQAGSPEKVLPGRWGNHTVKTITIMVWGQTQWNQPILGAVKGGTSPAAQSDSLAPAPTAEARVEGIPQTRFLANGTPAGARDLMDDRSQAKGVP